MKKINKSFLYKFSSFVHRSGDSFLSWTLYVASLENQTSKKIITKRPQAKHTLFQLWSFYLKNYLNFKTVKFIPHYTFKNKISCFYPPKIFYIIQTDSTIFSFCTINQVQKISLNPSVFFFSICINNRY